MNSMTGFGRGIVNTEELMCQVEAKSVNSRYCDIFIKMPRQLQIFEDLLRQAIQGRIHRGKVELSVQLKEVGNREKQFTVNRALSTQIKDFLVEEGFYESPDRVPLQAVMSISNDWVQLEDIPLAEESIQAVLVEAANLALEGLVDMRGREGDNIKADLLQRLAGVEEIFKEVEAHKDVALEQHGQRLLERIQSMMEKTGLDISMDRFYQEVAILSDKVDITEEIVRFASHVVQLKDILDEEGPIGRKLDFLLQEMNREVNTMGSKGNDLSITDRVVQLKVELEKVREQVQNVE